MGRYVADGEHATSNKQTFRNPTTNATMSFADKQWTLSCNDEDGYAGAGITCSRFDSSGRAWLGA